MINTIRKSKVTKVIASYLAIQMVIQMTQPMQLLALTSGPSQPEFNSFTPIGTSDMVNLSSGNFNYNIPIMDVGGYPLNLAYDSGITMDQEASWVGLGWNLNVGQINRQVRGLPDDFSGDLMRYENDMKTNKTVGVGINTTIGWSGIESPLIDLNEGIIVQHNNYEGITFKRSMGIGYQLNDNVRIGVDISSAVGDGATVNPMVSLSGRSKENADNYITTMTGSVGVSYNSRRALESVNLGFVVNATQRESYMDAKELFDREVTNQKVGGPSGTISFNNNTFTPTKRAGITHGNFSFAGSIGPSYYGVDLQFQVNGFGSFQEINEDDRDKRVPAFGYENTEKGEGLNGVLDFNREKDRVFNKHTTVVPVSNYTYDLYAIQGQGVQGMFRPYRSQVSYLYDHRVIDQGTGASFGVKFGAGWNFYAGGKQEYTPSFGETGKWVDNNNALGKFLEFDKDKNPLDYEPSYFKMIGERRIDQEETLFTDKLHNNNPMKLEISGSKFHRRAEPAYRVKDISGNITYPDPLKPINSSKLKRTQRDLRNQNILKVSKAEAINDPLVEVNANAKSHHTAGMKILKPDGSTYVYGETAYNLKKVEATFDVSGRPDIDCSDGTIGFSNPKNDASRYSDQYLNRITTPEYAHSYLLSSVLSSDYEDIDNNGPSVNDLGAYTLFEYETPTSDYKWRIPYEYTKASYNEGLKSNEDDQKANYLYGEKELKYINKIETKTHTAIFHLSNREDARGAQGEKTDEGTEGYMRKIDSISLYSKPEYDQLGENASYIKRAHFEYNYELCKGVPNNLNNEGKLTLDKVYFTYRGSNMGKYTPYVFNYDGFNPDYNLKSYDIWGNYKPVVKEKLNYINGEVEYKPNENGVEVPSVNNSFEESTDYCKVSGSLLAPEFPFVQQDDKKLQDAFASAWTMTSIDLPSGGNLELEYESDDYQYVQKRRAMQMFKITGAGFVSNPDNFNEVENAVLYNSGDHKKYIYAKLSDQVLSITEQDFVNDYLGDQIDKPIQFRMLLNMVDGKEEQSDYVSGYFEIDRRPEFQIKLLKEEGKGTYAAIPLKFLKREGGFINSNKEVNPIAKAGWYFGRQYLNRQVYSLNGNATNDTFEEVLNEIVGSIGAVAEIFIGPNGKLQEKRSSRKFEAEKSWVRLLNPNKRKLGGGVRVKQIKMHDAWGAMVNDQSNPNYSQFYGQQYNYNKEDGSSYGVATFEPNGSKENPFVEPFYDEKPNGNFLGKDKLLSPQAFNYAEKPFGESFFPSSTVTYSRVEVKNLPRKRTENGDTYVVKKSATGKVVSERYTTWDFPTIVRHTDITKANDVTPVLFNILTLGVSDRNHLTLSQGFTIETNDMNGKLRKQSVFPENQKDPISEVEYLYNVKESGELNNILPVIDSKGNVITDKSIGKHYDVINEFREHKSSSNLVGVNMNLTGFLVLIYPAIIPIPLPAYSDHEDILRTATTTKVIHKTGILVEKIARDLESEVSTKNIAWDAQTGDVLLTRTINEYDDYYYNFNYPAHWAYDGMGLASKNIGISGELGATENVPKFSLVDVDAGKTHLDYFRNGDELMTLDRNTSTEEKLWVVNVTETDITLMNSRGFLINQECSDYATGNLKFKIVRSGYRNQQMASMASVTSMVNPLRDTDNDGVVDTFSTNAYDYNGSGTNNPKIVNASAVEYTDYWKPQREQGLPGFPSLLADLYDKISNGEIDEDGNELTDADLIVAHKYGFNPYLYNVRGDWRAVNSYAHLTGRNSDVDAPEFSTASNGFFTSFSNFYKNSEDGVWKKDQQDWTFASKVTKYSPYGAELENKDALNRYSAAQYGYDYTLPVAVASNSEYKEIGFDGFEDYQLEDVIGSDSQSAASNFRALLSNSHFDFKRLLLDNRESVEISDEASHTGKYSIKVSGSSTKTVSMSLLDYESVVGTIRCNTGGSGSTDEPNDNCNNRRKRIFLKGDPNEDISYTYAFRKIGLNSDECVYSKYLTVNGVTYSTNGGSNTIRLDSNGEREFIVSGGATGYFGFSTNGDVEWEVNFAAGTSSNAVRVLLKDLCDDRGCNTTGNPVGGTGF
ncbi:hypothetical protein [uncultured Aquimarina sp.]|uniref:hypothetical protein n=1 Tax=uncultured Aquimarina sp. TaxID=575652 RepID=UPI00262785C2|nr:hypothetical protein [uncultured Aquimarina sp.]